MIHYYWLIHRFCSNFTKFCVSVHLVSYLIQDSTLYLVTLSSFSCMQQILVNSLFIFILFQIFSNFPCYGFLDTSLIQKWTFNFTIHRVLKVSLILISHFDVISHLNMSSMQSPSVFFFQSSNFIEVFSS